MNAFLQEAYTRVPVEEDELLASSSSSADGGGGGGGGVKPLGGVTAGACLLHDEAGIESTLRLIAAIDALRSVIADSTHGPPVNPSPKSKGHVPGFSIPGQEFGDSGPRRPNTSDVPMKFAKSMSLKDDRLKIRKEKVRECAVLVFNSK